MSQASDILDYLKAHEEGITPLEALRLFGCMRLAARIADLKADGHTIAMTEEAHEGGRHARYRLVTSTERRIIPTVEDWEGYRDSPHARYGHALAESWCLWCRRITDEAARFEVRMPNYAPRHQTAAPEEREPTLWDAA